ncbi:MAG TPA: sigma-54 dependent transcriptional regulator [Polyangia bacterium]|nr:sigma-54 dependent transcriptional regulator [Polyangia bacterium]
MPKLRSPGYGRPCLMVGRSADGPVAKILLEAGFEVEAVGTEPEALAALDRKAWTLVFVAQTLGKAALQSLIVHAAEKRSDLPVLVLGATATLQEAVDAMQVGAADFIAPPFTAELILSRLKRLVAETSEADSRPPAAPTLGYLGLTGRSPAMAKVYAAIARIGRYKTNVLLLGESGSGKELIARALHATGPRKNHLFVPLNCATLGRDILENELFGHERGAFTGANDRKKGLFELADGGTLFLDEIAELDPSTQAKLLRVIERNEFRRVGGTGKIKVDLSLIAATNRNLDEAIAAKRFREDLYYRLKVVTIRVPPLRERREDIPALIDAFIADFNHRNEGKIKGISPEALRRLADYDWRGNVRELKNAVESAAVMATGDTIGMGDFETVQLSGEPTPWQQGPTNGEALDAISLPAKATLAEAERILITEHLARARTKNEAARTLGIGLRTLYTKIHTLRLSVKPRGKRSSAQA